MARKSRVAIFSARYSLETRLKMSESRKGKKGHPCSEELKKQLSDDRRGKKFTLEHRRKLSEARKGIKLSLETRKKMSRPGSLHPLWIADRSKLKRYTGSEERRSQRYRHWRKEVWTRDGWKCRLLNKDCLGHIEAHHIFGWTDYPDLRYSLENGITLCYFHHPRKRNEEKRLIPTFQKLVKQKIATQNYVEI